MSTFSLIAWIPLGVLGLLRWGSWLVRRIPAALYRPFEGKYDATIAVVVPVYQEDPVVFAHAIESWMANGVDEIILVIDVTDNACVEVANRYPVTIVMTDVPGKRDALVKGWEVATTDLVALVDSDTIWAHNVASEVRKPFADPKVGGVGTRQNVFNPKGFWQRINDIYLDYRYFDENAAQTVVGHAVSCLSGRTAIYRRALLVEIKDDFMGETFWGIPCMSGDDKRLTTLILERGHDAVLQRSARVWSTFPNTGRIFLKQRLRWARNTWRSDLRAVSHRWIWNRPFLAYTMLDKMMSSFTLLLAPTFMTIGLFKHDWDFCIVLAIWWYVSRCAKLLPHLRRRPSSLLIIPFFILLSFGMSLVKLWALATIRQQRWLTRQVSVINGEVVRVGAAADAAEDIEAAAEAAAEAHTVIDLNAARPLSPELAQ